MKHGYEWNELTIINYQIWIRETGSSLGINYPVHFPIVSRDYKTD